MIVLRSLQDPTLPKLLHDGAVGVMPTDTVYGLVCRASDTVAVEKLYALKHRHNKPGTIIAASIEQLVELGLKARYLKAVERFWPGPISVVIPTHDLAHLHLGKQSLAVRIPNVPEITQLLQQTGPLLSTSANAPGEPVATTQQEAAAYFGDSVNFYVDGGDMSGHKASTVLRIVDDAVEVLRHGDVDVDDVGHIIVPKN